MDGRKPKHLAVGCPFVFDMLSDITMTLFLFKCGIGLFDHHTLAIESLCVSTRLQKFSISCLAAEFVETLDIAGDVYLYDLRYIQGRGSN